MINYLAGVGLGLILAFIIGMAGVDSAQSQCKRVNHVEHCVMLYVPATQSSDER